MLDRWRQFFSQLLNPGNVGQGASSNEIAQVECEGIVEEREDIVPSSNLEEIGRAIQRIKNNKAPDIDNTPGELIKCGGRALVNAIYSLIVKIWNTKQLYKILLEFDILLKLVRLVRMSMKETTGRVKIGGELTEEFQIF